MEFLKNTDIIAHPNSGFKDIYILKKLDHLLCHTCTIQPDKVNGVWQRELKKGNIVNLTFVETRPCFSIKTYHNMIIYFLKGFNGILCCFNQYNFPFK